jgi:TatD DNase family protein
MKLPTTVGWGECGLDYFKMFSPQKNQIEAFSIQLKHAVASRKTLVVHSRDAYDDTLRLMTEALPEDYPIHFHCCSYNGEQISPLVKRFSNCYFGITGKQTSPKPKGLLQTIPLNRLLLETDGPFLRPRKKGYS